MPFAKETHYQLKKKFKKIPKPTKCENPLNPKRKTNKKAHTHNNWRQKEEKTCFTLSGHILCWPPGSPKDSVWPAQCTCCGSECSSAFSQLIQPHGTANRKPQKAPKMGALQTEEVWLTLAAEASPELWDCPAGFKPHYPGYAWFLLLYPSAQNRSTASKPHWGTFPQHLNNSELVTVTLNTEEQKLVLFSMTSPLPSVLLPKRILTERVLSIKSKYLDCLTSWIDRRNSWLANELE